MPAVNGCLQTAKQAPHWQQKGFHAAAIENAKTGTMAYNIMQAHNTSGDAENLKIKFDAMASHDITFVGIIQTARASGLEKFPIPYVLTNCHNSLCAVGGTINEDDHRFGPVRCQKYGGIFVPPHMAVIHQYMREKFAGCGKMILARTPTPATVHWAPWPSVRAAASWQKQLLGRTYDVARPGVVAIYLTGSLLRAAAPRCGHCAGGQAVQERLCQEQGDGVCRPRHCVPASGYPQRHRCHDHRDHLPVLHLGNRRNDAKIPRGAWPCRRL